MSPSRDFKSLASAYSATSACVLSFWGRRRDEHRSFVCYFTTSACVLSFWGRRRDEHRSFVCYFTTSACVLSCLLSTLRIEAVHCTASLEAPSGFGPEREGFADPCLTTWLRCRCCAVALAALASSRTSSKGRAVFGAGDGTRTRDFHLGKVTLYH